MPKKQEKRIFEQESIIFNVSVYINIFIYMRDVEESIQDYKIDVMFMAETWHDPESIGMSKLRSRGLVVFEKTRSKFPCQ